MMGSLCGKHTNCSFEMLVQLNGWNELELWRTGPPLTLVHKRKATWGCWRSPPVGKRPVAVLEGQSTATTPTKAPEDSYINRTVSSTGPNTLVIPGKIDDLNCDFVIDTGSDISITHSDMLPSGKRQIGFLLLVALFKQSPVRWHPQTGQLS